MHVVFRVDSSLKIGTGHVMRCLTLAKTLLKEKHTVSFICRNLEGNLIEHIEKNHFDVARLNDENATENPSHLHHADWLGTSWQQDAGETIEILDSLHAIDWLVIDHYALDIKWEESVKTHVGNIIVIDDLADRKHSANILLDQNYYADMNTRYDELIPENTVHLIGPEYTLLRDEFTEKHGNIKPRTGKIENILIFFGGTDSENLTLKSINSLKTIDTIASINVVIGNTNPNKNIILNCCGTMRNVTCHINIDNISTLMQKADLSLGAGGTTTWERCYLGLPAIVFTLAHNQAAVNTAVSNLGACILMDSVDISEDELNRQVQQLIDTPTIVASMSKAALEVMSKHVGTTGVISAMESADA